MTPETRSGRRPTLVGSVLERRYRVDSLIARGGMSVVYRGLDTRLDRFVAIKVMDSRYSGDPSFVDRFEREARAAARIQDPHVVAVYDQGVDREGDEDHVYLVMQLVEGCTLRDLLLERGSLPPELALSVLAPMLAALTAAHEAGMVHRDIKPENVLIGLDGSVKVADFGLVRAAASTGTTSANIILGTVAYLSPEQVETGAADARSDLYAAGIVLYEMLTGQPPYVGDTALSIAYRHVNDDVPAPGELVPDLPPALDNLVLRATRRQPASRLESASAFLAELQRVRTNLRLRQVAVPVATSAQRTAVTDMEDSAPPTERMPAVPDSAGGAAGPQGTRALPRSGPATGPVPARRVQPPAPRRRRRWLLWWTLIVLLLAGLVGAGAWWLGRGQFTTVPTINGDTETVATTVLERAHLVPHVARTYDDSVPEGTVISSAPAQGSHVLRGREVNVVVSLGKPVVPEITPGTTVAEAERALRDAQLQPALDQSAEQYSATVPKGRVVAVSPTPGSRLDSQSPVTLILSKGPQPVTVPDVRGKSQADAFATLTAAGFDPYVASIQFSASAAGGDVVNTDPAPGSTIPLKGRPRIAIVLSNAATVPNFTGMSVSEAKQEASAAGVQLSVESFLQRSNAMVFGQFPLPGTNVRPGTTIHVTAF